MCIITFTVAEIVSAVKVATMSRRCRTYVLIDFSRHAGEFGRYNIVFRSHLLHAYNNGHVKRTLTVM